MMTTRIARTLVTALCFGISACGGGADDPEQFQTDFQKAVEAAEKGRAINPPGGKKKAKVQATAMP